MLEILRPGVVPYLEAWELQRSVHAGVVSGERPDTLILLEHPAVYTAGKRTEPHERPFDGTPVVDVDRGGKITWHGPGQITGYPIVRLPEPVDVVSHVRRLEAAMIAVCADLGRRGRPGRGAQRHLGAWPTTAGRTARSARSASGSPRASRCTGSRSTATATCGAFETFVPCGITDAGVTSLSAELGRDVTVDEVLPLVERRMTEVLERGRASARVVLPRLRDQTQHQTGDQADQRRHRRSRA